MERETNAARDLYEEFARHTTAIGAYFFSSSVPDNAKIDFARRSAEITRLCECVPSPPSLQDDRSVILFQAPSPWHAVIHLLSFNRISLAEQFLGVPTCLIFRGQRDCRWGLVPSIDRDADVAAEEQKTLDVFIQLMEHFFRSPLQSMTDTFISPTLVPFYEGPPMPRLIHVGTAQHFGIRTNLLDFTVDPSVAVWFACQGAKGGNEEMASVFALPLDVGRLVGASIAFPHPYVRRLYRQRGVFVEPVQGKPPLRRLCVEMRFPPDPTFEVLREDMRRPELLPTDEWWLLLVRAARRIVANKSELKLQDLKANAPKAPPGCELFSFLMDEGCLSSKEEDLLLAPGFLNSNAKEAQLEECALQLSQMLLCLTTVLENDTTSRVIRAAVKQCAANSGPALAALLPFVQRAVSRMPATSFFRTLVEKMVSHLINELETLGHWIS